MIIKVKIAHVLLNNATKFSIHIKRNTATKFENQNGDD